MYGRYLIAVPHYSTFITVRGEEYHETELHVHAPLQVRGPRIAVEILTPLNKEEFELRYTNWNHAL